MCLAVAVTVTVGQETGEDQGDGRGGANRGNRECNLFSGCKEFGKELFKIKDKIDGVIGIKKTIKNSVGTKIIKIKNFAGDVLDTKYVLLD